MGTSPLRILFLVVFMDLVGFGLVLPILPLYADDLGGSPAYIGVLLASYSAMQFLFNPLWGRLSDRVGRRPVILVSLAGATGSYLLYGLAERLAFAPGGALVPLLVSRVLAGIMAANIGTAQAYVADVTPPDRRAGGMGLMGAAIGLGFVLGPALGALFTAEMLRSRFGLGIAGFAAAAICGSNLVWAWLALPESLPAGHRATVRREGLLTRRTLLLTYPPLLLLLGVLFLNSLSFSQFEATFSLLSRHRLGLTPTQIGLIFSYLGGIVVVTQGWLARRWVARLGERVTLALGVVLMGVGLGSLPWFGDAWLLGLPLALLGIGYGALQPSQLALISKHSPATRQGLALGLGQAMGSLARVLGPLIALGLFGKVAEAAPFWLGALLAAVALALVTLLPAPAGGEAPGEEIRVRT